MNTATRPAVFQTNLSPESDQPITLSRIGHKWSLYFDLPAENGEAGVFFTVLIGEADEVIVKSDRYLSLADYLVAISRILTLQKKIIQIIKED